MELNKVCPCPSWFFHELSSFTPASDVSSVNSSKDSVIAHPTPSVWASLSFKEAGQTAWEAHGFYCHGLITFNIFDHVIYRFLVPTHCSLQTFSFLHPHVYFLSLCALLSPQRSIWLKEWKATPAYTELGTLHLNFQLHRLWLLHSMTTASHRKRTVGANVSEPSPWSLSGTPPYLLAMGPWARNNCTELQLPLL